MSFDIKWKQNGVSQLLCDENNLIYPWGIETSDSKSFFTLTDKGQFIDFADKNQDSSSNEFKRRLLLDMQDGSGALEIRENYSGNTIDRNHSYAALEDSLLLDFVSRYVFKKRFFDSATIAGQEITHQNANIYRQYSADSVTLKGERHKADIKILETNHPENFQTVMYVRDEPDKWVVHIRILPEQEKNVAVKLNYSFYNQALPRPVQKLIWSIKCLRKQLLYRGERKHKPSFLYKLLYKLFPLSAYPMGRLQKGEKMQIKSRCRINC